jgi:hypothetical protein
MKLTNNGAASWVACLLFALAPLPGVAASDADNLTAMLREFLAAAHKESAHRTFWADDLVYTSSNGTRFGKAEILAGFAEVDDSEEPPAVAYSAEAIDVRVFGTSAIVAFKLLGTPSDGSPVLEYFNTGTFLKRQGNWQVMAWQATLVGKDDAAAD